MMPFIRGFADELEKTSASAPVVQDQHMAELTALVEKVAEQEAAYTVRGPASPQAKPAAAPKGTFVTHRGHAIKQANLEAPADGMAGSSPLYGTGKGPSAAAGNKDLKGIQLGLASTGQAINQLGARFESQKAMNTQLGGRGLHQGQKAVAANKGMMEGQKAVTANKGMAAGARANQTMGGVANLAKKAGANIKLALDDGIMTPSFMQNKPAPTSKQPGNGIMTSSFMNNGARADRPMTQLPGQLRALTGNKGHAGKSNGGASASKKSETPQANKPAVAAQPQGHARERMYGAAAGAQATTRMRAVMENARSAQANKPGSGSGAAAGANAAPNMTRGSGGVMAGHRASAPPASPPSVARPAASPAPSPWLNASKAPASGRNALQRVRGG